MLKFKKKSFITFFVLKEEGHLRRRTLTVFKLLIFLSIIELYMHGITFSDIYNFFITEILAWNHAIFFSNVKCRGVG